MAWPLFPRVDCVWNVMAHAQKPDFVFRRNWRVPLNRRGRQFSQLLAAEVCASAVVILDTPCSEVVWRVLATHSIRQFPLPLPCVTVCHHISTWLKLCWYPLYGRLGRLLRQAGRKRKISAPTLESNRHSPSSSHIPVTDIKYHCWKSSFSEVTPIIVVLLLGTFAELRKSTVSYVMSVRPSAWKNSAPAGRICLKFWSWGGEFSEVCRENWCLVNIEQE